MLIAVVILIALSNGQTYNVTYEADIQWAYIKELYMPNKR